MNNEIFETDQLLITSNNITRYVNKIVNYTKELGKLSEEVSSIIDKYGSDNITLKDSWDDLSSRYRKISNSMELDSNRQIEEIKMYIENGKNINSRLKGQLNNSLDVLNDISARISK